MVLSLHCIVNQIEALFLPFSFLQIWKGEMMKNECEASFLSFSFPLILKGEY